MRTRGPLVAAAAGGLLLFLVAICGVLDLVAGAPGPLPPPPGPPGGPFKVAVLGDAQKGITNLRNLLSRLQTESPAFYLQTGDFVSDDDEGHYRLLGWVLRESGIAQPAVVPGNHDVKRGPERFVRSFGPLEKSFTVGEVAFVLLDNSAGLPPNPKHVEARIAAAGPSKAVVLAMHVPPFDVQGRPLEAYAPFLKWLESSGVAYLLCGHVHAYLRIPVGKTVVIVNGIGGDSDAGQRDPRVCATLLEVDGASIRDRLVEIAPAQGAWDHVRHFAVGHVREGFRSRPLPWGLLAVGAGGLAGWGLGRLRRTA